MTTTSLKEITTTTLENIVAITRSVDQDSASWLNIAAHSTSPDDQSWFWTPEWQTGEREATLDIGRGELSEKLYGVDEIRQYLDTL